MHFHYLVSTAWFYWLVVLCGGYAVDPASVGSFWYRFWVPDGILFQFHGALPCKIYFELGTIGLVEDDLLPSLSVISSDNVLSFLSA